MNRSITAHLAIGNLISVLVAVAGGAIGLFFLQHTIDHYEQQVRRLTDAQAEILEAQYSFKLQVQEWKDVLLRGKDQKKLETHWRSFEAQEKIVADTIGRVEIALPDGHARQLAADFLAAHRALSGAYREALVAFKSSGGDPFVGDAAVTGIDRSPARLLDEVVRKIGALVASEQAKAGKKARTALIIASLSIIVSVVGGLMFFRGIMYQSRRIEEERSIAAIAFESREAMVVTDADNIVMRINRAFTQVSGYDAGEIIGKSLNLLKSGRHNAEFFAAMWRSIQEDGFWQGEIWNRRRDGEIFPALLTVTAVHDPAGRITHYVGSFTDITRRVEDENEIRNLAFYDPLTGLANRRLLADRLRHAFAKSGRSRNHGAVLFIDLDRFKEINDTLGHAQGDRLLELVADRLTVGVREDDTVARLGGDEFMVLLEELDFDRKIAADKAAAIAEKLRSALNIPYKLQQVTGTSDWHCSPSIGAALFLGHDEDVAAVLAQADKALYAAKEGGRNTVRLAG